MNTKIVKSFFIKGHALLKTASSIYNVFEKNYSILKMVDLSPPAEVRGITKLDRSLFVKTVNVPCLKVKCDSVEPLIKTLKKYFLKLPNFKAIRPFKDETGPEMEREVFLNPKVVSSFDDISAEDQEKLVRQGIDKSVFDVVPLQLTYENWTADEIISAVIPKGVETASGYSLLGHIVHLNLREHLLEYKYVIGEVLLDKIKQARTVVKKVDNIDSEFRVFKMELLAGDSDFITEVKENGFLYKFDFSSVYFNPRLCTEHERIVRKLSPGNVLYDVFAGVGPFSIPAAKKKCDILANDLNPESFKWLQHNAKLNKVERFLKFYNKDGADFLKEDVKEHILQEKGERKSHIVMNLPAIAVKFLHVFRQFFTLEQLKLVKILPMVHVYCFTKGEGDPKKLAQELVESELNLSISEAVEEIFFVRNVAPNKNMMRVSFQLTENMVVDVKRKLENSESNEQGLKRSRETKKRIVESTVEM